MSLLDIPEAVIKDHLLPFLGWNDLLRLRRVCKHTKTWADSFIKKKPNENVEIQIIEGNCFKSFGNFLTLDIPASRFYICNISGRDFFLNDKDISPFLKKFADKVTHLRLRNFTAFSCKMERHFYKSLSNLKSLEVEQVDCDIDHSMADFPSYHLQFDLLPGNFRKLKSLKFSLDKHSRDWCRGQRDEAQFMIMSIISFCDELEYLMFPICVCIGTENYDNIFSAIENAVLDRKEVDPSKPNLKYFDLGCHYEFTRESFTFGDPLPSSFPGRRICLVNDTHTTHQLSAAFLELCMTLGENNVKILNVNASMFQRIFHDLPNYRRLSDTVLSMTNLHSNIHSFSDMPILEHLAIKATSVCTMTPMGIMGPRHTWPALKSMDVNVDSIRLREQGDNVIPVSLAHFPTGGPPGTVDILDTIGLFHFLFVGICRQEMRQLRLRYEPELIAKCLSKGIPVPCPRAKHISTCCPNLTKLILVNWPGTNKALLKLWQGLLNLEEICLEGCKTLGDVVFIGEDVERPSFFKLKKLKKLSLKRLDEMPKITDLSFNLVFRHLKLTEFHLENQLPLTSVSVEGIRLLLTGKFSQSIEKFSLKKLRLESVNLNELMQLEKQFRSFDMM